MGKAFAISLTEGGGMPIGTVFEVHDPKKQFYGAIGTQDHADLSACSGDTTYLHEEPGAIGWANLVLGSDGTYTWEIEQCTMPCNRITAKADDSTSTTNVFKGLQTEVATTAVKVGFNSEDFSSVWPCVDTPRDVICSTLSDGSELEIEVFNPKRLTVCPGSEILIRSTTTWIPTTEYDANSVDDIPPVNAVKEPTALRQVSWELVHADQTIARWIRVKLKDEDGCVWEYDDQYAEGEDPLKFVGNVTADGSKEDIEIEAAPGLEYCCEGSPNNGGGKIPSAGEIGWAIWDPNTTKYLVVTTKSAMLGGPTAEDYLYDIEASSLGSLGSGCRIDLLKKKGLLGWKCEESQKGLEIPLKTRDITYMEGMSGGCNFICPILKQATVLDCGEFATPGSVDCLPIYADPCDPDPCVGDCEWESVKDGVDGFKWQLVESNSDCFPYSEGESCYCKKPCDPPTSLTDISAAICTDIPPDVYVGGGSCTICGSDLTVSQLDWTSGKVPAELYTLDTSKEVTSVGDCSWVVPILWSKSDSPGVTVEDTATVTFSSGSPDLWTITPAAPPSGYSSTGAWEHDDTDCADATNGIVCEPDDVDCDHVDDHTNNISSMTMAAVGSQACPEDQAAPAAFVAAASIPPNEPCADSELLDENGKQLCHSVSASVIGPSVQLNTGQSAPLFTMSFIGSSLGNCGSSFEWNMTDRSLQQASQNLDSQPTMSSGVATIAVEVLPNGKFAVGIQGLPLLPTIDLSDSLSVSGRIGGDSSSAGDPSGSYSQTNTSHDGTTVTTSILINPTEC